MVCKINRVDFTPQITINRLVTHLIHPIWKKYMRIFLLFLFICSSAVADDFFDDRGVWYPMQTVTMEDSERVSFGVIDVSDREPELNILVYGEGPDDSLVFTLTIYGMMSPDIADTNKSVSIFSSTQNLDEGGIALADTLDSNQMFPYLYGNLYNINNADSTYFDLWFFMKQKDITLLRK